MVRQAHHDMVRQIIMTLDCHPELVEGLFRSENLIL